MPDQTARYRLRRANGQPLQLRSAHWHCEGIYLSDVCLAVCLQRLPESPEDAAKDDLRALLRGIGHLALSENLWRPVVGVVEDNDGSVGPLGADQEWHRGDFLVFVTNEPQKRLEDLLLPGELLPELLEQESESRNPAWFRREIDKRLAHAERADEIRALVELLLPPPKVGEAQSFAQESSMREDFRSWLTNVRNKAEDIALGREP